jgi:hypothetical protein
MNKLALLCISIGLGVAPSFIQSAAKPNHLIPDISSVANGWSQTNVASEIRFFTVFGQGYGEDVELRAVAFPSFSNEYLVGIRSTHDDGGTITGYRAFYLMPKISLHAYESLRGAEGGLVAMDPNDPQDAEAYKKQSAYIAQLKAALPTEPKDIPVAQCEKPLENSVAEKIATVWRGVLLETHYDLEGSGGNDGITYHFYASGKYQSLAGWTWSPDKDSKPGMLTDVADTLVAYCDGKAVAADLEKKANALARALRPER